MRVTVTFSGGPDLKSAFAALSDTRELTEAQVTASRTLVTAARSLAPSGSGTLAGSINATVTDRVVDVGSQVRYARWFHVPYLSDGGVTYAKKVSSRGRSYGQRIPNLPFLNQAVAKAEQSLAATYTQAVGALIDRAMSGVPRG